MTSIRTTGLTKDFGGLRAVDNINIDLPQGGVAGFVGPNGSGKSTTMPQTPNQSQQTRPHRIERTDQRDIR